MDKPLSAHVSFSCEITFLHIHRVIVNLERHQRLEIMLENWLKPQKLKTIISVIRILDANEITI